MSNRESSPAVPAAFAFLVFLVLVGLTAFFVGKALLHSDPRPSCESVGAHVVWLDDDHTVCVRNGRVV